MTVINPFFCPQCPRIRGIGGATLLVGPETLMYDSFGMCTACYYFDKDEAQKNIQQYEQLKQEKQQQRDLEESKKIYTVYCEDSSVFGSSTIFFNKIIQKIDKSLQFSTATETRNGCEHVVKLRTKVNEETAKKIVELLSEKNTKCWYELLQIYYI